MKLGWGRIPVIVAFSLGLCYSCSGSSRGNECQQTQELDLRDQSRPPCPLPRPGNILSAHHSHLMLMSLSHGQLFATPWTAAHQAFLSFTISWSLLKLISIELVMPSHLFPSCPQSFLALGSFLMSRLFTSDGPFQGFSLEKVMCYRDHLD